MVDSKDRPLYSLIKTKGNQLKIKRRSIGWMSEINHSLHVVDETHLCLCRRNHFRFQLENAFGKSFLSFCLLLFMLIDHNQSIDRFAKKSDVRTCACFFIDEKQKRKVQCLCFDSLNRIDVVEICRRCWLVCRTIYSIRFPSTESTLFVLLSIVI